MQVCPTAMGRILYFMYSGHIRVTELTVCTLLPAATMFQVTNVIDACCAFLERQLDPTNAIGIANFAEQHGCTTLKQRANQFIERHFTQVSGQCLSNVFFWFCVLLTFIAIWHKFHSHYHYQLQSKHIY